MYFPPSPAEQPPLLLDALVESYDHLATSLHLPLIDRELHDALFLADLRTHVKELQMKKKNPNQNLAATVAGLLGDNNLGPKAEALQLVVDRLLQVQRRTVTVIACMEHRETILASLIRTNNFYEKNGCTLDDAQQTFLHALQEYQIVTLLVTEAIFQWRELLSRPMPFLLRNGEDCLRRIQADSAALACCAVGQSLSLHSDQFPCMSTLDIPKIRRRQQMLRKARLINTKAVLQRGFDPVEAPKTHYDSKPQYIYGAPTLWRRRQPQRRGRGGASMLGSDLTPRSQYAATTTGGGGGDGGHRAGSEAMATALEQLAAMLQANSSSGGDQQRGPQAMTPFGGDAFSTSTGGSPAKKGTVKERKSQKGKESRLSAAEKIITGESAVQARLTEELWVTADEHDCFVPLLPIPELFVAPATPKNKKKKTAAAAGKGASGAHPPLPEDALPLNKSNWAELFNTAYFQTRARTKSRMSMNSEAITVPPGQRHGKAAARALNFATGKRDMLSSASSHSSFSRSASSSTSSSSSSSSSSASRKRSAARRSAPTVQKTAKKREVSPSPSSSEDDFEKASSRSSASSRAASSSSSAASARKSSAAASKHSSHSSQTSTTGSERRRASTATKKEETEAPAAAVSAPPAEATPNADTWVIPRPVPMPVAAASSAGPASPVHPASSSHSTPRSSSLGQNRRLSASLEKLRMQVLQERGMSISQRDDVASGGEQSPAGSSNGLKTEPSGKEDSSAKVSSASPFVSPPPVPAVPKKDMTDPLTNMKPPSSSSSSSRSNSSSKATSNQTSSSAFPGGASAPLKDETEEEKEKEKSTSVGSSTGSSSSKKASSPAHPAGRKPSVSAEAYSDEFEDESDARKSSRAASPSVPTSSKPSSPEKRDRSINVELAVNKRKNSTSAGGAYSADFSSDAGDEDSTVKAQKKKSASASEVKSSVASSSASAASSSRVAKAQKKSSSRSSSIKSSSSSSPSSRSSSSSSPVKAKKKAAARSPSSSAVSSSPASSRASSEARRRAPAHAEKAESSIADDTSSSAKSTTDSDDSDDDDSRKKLKNKTAGRSNGSLSSITFSSVEA